MVLKIHVSQNSLVPSLFSLEARSGQWSHLSSCTILILQMSTSASSTSSAATAAAAGKKRRREDAQAFNAGEIRCDSPP